MATILRGELTAGVHVERTSESISDLLFQEMRTLKATPIRCQDIRTGEIYYDDSTNKYDQEADTYVNRITFGDFSNPNPNPKAEKPIFKIDANDFSSELKADLAERVIHGKESIHRVVQKAVYRLFRARHETAFFDYIKDKRLRWEFV
ncbi:MAG: hypothetical protein WAZ77_09315 [Candidatus Nitrosopolaris sp.]